jgi:hypothetical protein
LGGRAYGAAAPVQFAEEDAKGDEAREKEGHVSELNGDWRVWMRC